jgi:hypothetical protein
MSSVKPPSNDQGGSKNKPPKDPTLAFLKQQFPSAQEMIEMDNLFNLTPAIKQNTGQAPSQAGSLETSRTWESSQATPVPALVKRETMLSLLSPSQTDQLGLPRVHIQQANLNSEEVRVAAAILDSQWTLFMKARAANNTQLMRDTLMQAYTNQLVLLQLVGQEEMMKLSHNWSAKAELNKLEAQMLSQQNSLEMIVNQDVSLLLCQSQPDKSNIKRDIITTVLRPINMTNNIKKKLSLLIFIL